MNTNRISVLSLLTVFVSANLLSSALERPTRVERVEYPVTIVEYPTNPKYPNTWDKVKKETQQWKTRAKNSATAVYYRGRACLKSSAVQKVLVFGTASLLTVGILTATIGDKVYNYVQNQAHLLISKVKESNLYSKVTNKFRK